jgi:transposase
MGRTRRSFSKEFKLEAVRLMTEGGHSISQVARDLGIRDTILGRWKKNWEQDRDAAFPGKGQVKPAEAELRHLRRENERLRMERDILKKAAAIFSKDSL